MAKTSGSGEGKGTKTDKGAKNRRSALLGGGAAEIGSGSADPRGKVKVAGTWRTGQGGVKGGNMTGFANGDGALQGKAGVGKPGAKRGRPPGVKNGQGRGKR